MFFFLFREAIIVDWSEIPSNLSKTIVSIARNDY